MFLVLTLPRSRSAWLAHYLSYPLARPLQPVGHDIMIDCSDVDAFLGNYTRGMFGTVETAGAMLWQIVRRELPECRIVLVRRPLIEVYRSLAAKGVVADIGVLAEMDQTLNFAACDPQIMSVPYELLSDPAVGKWLFEYLLELDWDEEWWQKLVATNIQVDLPAWIRKANGKREQFLELVLDVNRRNAEVLH